MSSRTGEKSSEPSDYTDSALSEYSFSGTSQSASPRVTRRIYKRAANTVKSTSDYADKRSRNNAAVQKFRSRSKTDMKTVEQDIATYSHLSELFEKENGRLEESAKTLQKLFQKHYCGTDVSAMIYQIIDSEAAARERFTASVAEMEANLSERDPGT